MVQGVLGALALRISRFGESLATAHGFGAVPGHTDPWTIEYQRAAFDIYRPHLSDPYLRWLGKVFGEAVPAARRVAGDCGRIVSEYLETASIVMLEGTATAATDRSTSFELSDRTPAVMPFTQIATLVSRRGASQLVEAGAVVHGDVGEEPEPPLSSEELSWLQRLAEGVRVVDLAVEVNYCERSMYRHLSAVWEKLNVKNRQTAIALAVREGWI